MIRIVATAVALAASSAFALAEEGRADRLLDFLEAASHPAPFTEVELSPTAHPRGGYFSAPPICLHLIGDPARIETRDQMRWLEQCQTLYLQVQGELMRDEQRRAGLR